MGSPSCGMDGSRSVRFRGLLQALLRHGVDFFVVGGVAAQLEGASIVTLDLDILYNKTPANLEHRDNDRAGADLLNAGVGQTLPASHRDCGNWQFRS